MLNREECPKCRHDPCICKIWGHMPYSREDQVWLDGGGSVNHYVQTMNDNFRAIMDAPIDPDTEEAYQRYLNRAAIHGDDNTPLD